MAAFAVSPADVEALEHVRALNHLDPHTYRSFSKSSRPRLTGRTSFIRADFHQPHATQTKRDRRFGVDRDKR